MSDSTTEDAFVVEFDLYNRKRSHLQVRRALQTEPLNRLGTRMCGVALHYVLHAHAYFASQIRCGMSNEQPRANISRFLPKVFESFEIKVR